MYFFMGKHVGKLMVERAFGTWPIGTPFLMLNMYCAAQTSFEIRNWDVREAVAEEAKKERKKKE